MKCNPQYAFCFMIRYITFIYLIKVPSKSSFLIVSKLKPGLFYMCFSFRHFIALILDYMEMIICFKGACKAIQGLYYSFICNQPQTFVFQTVNYYIFNRNLFERSTDITL